MGNNIIRNIPDELIENINMGILKCETDSTHKDFKVIEANAFAQKILGKPREEFIGVNFTEAFPRIKNSVRDLTEIFIRTSTEGGNIIIEEYIEFVDKVLSINIFSDEKHIFYLVLEDMSFKRNITKNLMEKDYELRILNENFRKKANLDPLTDVYNYQFIFEILKNETENARKDDMKLSVALFDIDGFGNINMENGVLYGDRILKCTAEGLKLSVRKIDSVGRIGSDEFMVILTNVNIEIAKIIVKRMLSQIEKCVGDIEGYESQISGAVQEYENESMDEYYKKLREKFDKAKKMGKNTIIF